jgi:hypothetical protein
MKRFRLKWTKSWGSITCGHATAATNFENNIGGLQEGFGSLPAQGLLRNHANTKQAGCVVVDSKIQFVSGSNLYSTTFQVTTMLVRLLCKRPFSCAKDVRPIYVP